MSNDNLPACPVCGEAPRYTLTFAGNHALRCDGPIPGDSPRHTIYVLHPQLDAARALWTKAVAQQPATAAPVTDADIDAAIRKVGSVGESYGVALASMDGDLYTPTSELREVKAELRALIARRLQQANAAAEDLRKRYDHLDLMMMFQSQLVAGVLAGKRIEGSDLLAQRQGHFTEGDVQLLELVRRVAAAEELARAVEFALEPGPLDGKEVAMTAEIRIAARALRQEKAERLRTALAAFRKAQGGGK